MKKLVDEFREAMTPALSSEQIETGDAFGDVLWPPLPPLSEIMADPAVSLRRGGRWFVIQRIGGEIRYWAGPMPDRVEEFTAGPRGELGVLASVADAVAFAEQFLDGASFREITVGRARV